jgi:pilus assembly protein CpaE
VESVRKIVRPALAQALPLAQVAECGEYPDRHSMGSVLQNARPNLALLDAESDPETAQYTLQQLQGMDGSLPVVVMISGNNPDAILRWMRLGAAELLTLPFTPDQLLEALSRLEKKLGSRNEAEGRVVCVMPAKGACGASTVASNLAYHWKKYGSKKILLADLDPLTGTQSFQLKIKSQYSFLDVLSRAGSLDADLWRGLISPLNGVDVLLAPDTLVQGIDQLSNPNEIVSYARAAYEQVFIDAGCAYGEWALNLARHCDDLLLITTNELPAVQAAQRTLRYLEANKVSRSKVKLVVNRYNRSVGLSQEVIGTALQTEIFHLLPSDYEAIHKSLMEGKPSPSNTNFGKSIAELGMLLGGKKAPEKEPEKKKGFFGSLFGR